MVSSGDEDDNVSLESASPIKRPARRQKPAVKYDFGDDDDEDDGAEDDEDDGAEDDWLDDNDDNDDSDFDL